MRPSRLCPRRPFRVDFRDAPKARLRPDRRRGVASASHRSRGAWHRLDRTATELCPIGDSGLALGPTRGKLS
jgi:hypothetical protein